MTETSERPAPAGTAAGDADLLTTLRGFPHRRLKAGTCARPLPDARARPTRPFDEGVGSHGGVRGCRRPYRGRGAAGMRRALRQ